jgi:hypothetical protein
MCSFTGFFFYLCWRALVKLPLLTWGLSALHCRDDDDGRRMHAFKKWLVQAGINAKVTVYIESLYVDTLKAADIDYVCGYRLWILLCNSSKVEAFLEQCQELFNEDPAERQRAKRSKRDIPRQSFESISRTDVAQVISQIYMGDPAEKLSVDYTASSEAAADAATFDSDSDDDDDDEEPNENSILHRLGPRYFSSEIQKFIMDGNGINDRFKEKDTYIKQDNGATYFQALSDDSTRFQLLCNDGATWLKPDANVLDTFLLPHEKPTAEEVRRWLLSLSHMVGASTGAIRKMTTEEVMEAAANLMAPTHMNPRQPMTKQAMPTGLTWSDQIAQSCLPMQAYLVNEGASMRSMVISATHQGKLPNEAIVAVDKDIIDNLTVVFTPGLKIKGLPEGPQRTRQAFYEDVALYNQIMAGHDTRSAAMLKRMLFPPKPPANMAWQTFFFDQINNFLQVHAGLNGQQSHIGSAVYILSYLVDYNGFGKPCSVQAEGPPGLGKSYIMKVLCEMINAGKVLKCNSFSKEAMTYQGMQEQTVLIMDENVNQGVKGGQTGANQSQMIDGHLKRFRANADTQTTEGFSVACRHVQFAASNHELNGAMKSRYCSLPVTSEGREKHFGKKSLDYAVMCLGWKLISGMTTAPWLMEMMKLVSPSTELYDVFCEVHATVYEDSSLKEKPRLKETVANMALGASLYTAISLYFRTKEQPVCENFSLELLQWLQVNWIVDPYSIWFSYTTQCRGNDINRVSKVLSWLKNNLKKTAAGTIDFPDSDPDYLITTFVENDSRMETEADTIGLGLAILQETINELTVKKGSAPPSIIKYVMGKSTHFCVHREHVKSQKTLTAAEQAIVQLLLSKKELRHASHDLQRWVYPRSVKEAITKNALRPPALKGCTDVDIELALTNMSAPTAFGLHIYTETSGGLRGSERQDQLAIVDPVRLLTSKRAPAGSILDPTYTDAVNYSVNKIIAGGASVDAALMTKYELMIAGKDPELAAANLQHEKLANTFFTAAGAADNELIFDGIGGKDSVSAYIQLDLFEGDVKVGNPAYMGHKDRHAAFVQQDSSVHALFDVGTPTITLNASSKLAAKLVESRVKNLYFDTSAISKVFEL